MTLAELEAPSGTVVEKVSDVLTVRVTPDLAERLRGWANAEGVGVSDFLRGILAGYAARRCS